MSVDYYRDKRLTSSATSGASLYFEGSGKVINLDKGMMTIGRDENCDIILDSNTLSRNHARIFENGSDWYLEDLGSVNGMSVDGKRVRSRERAKLYNNSRIVFADNLRARFYFEDAGSRVYTGTGFPLQEPVNGAAQERPNPYYNAPMPDRQRAEAQPQNRQAQYGAYAQPAGQMPPSPMKKSKKLLWLVLSLVLVTTLAAGAAAWMLSTRDEGQIDAAVYTMDYKSFVGKTTWTVTDKLDGLVTDNVALGADGESIERASFEGEDGSVKIVFFKDNLPEYATIVSPDGEKADVVYNNEEKIFIETIGEQVSRYDYDGNFIEPEEEINYYFEEETVTLYGVEVHPISINPSVWIEEFSISANTEKKPNLFVICVLLEGEEEWMPLLFVSPDENNSVERSFEEYSGAFVNPIEKVAIIPCDYETVTINGIEVCTDGVLKMGEGE